MARAAVSRRAILYRYELVGLVLPPPACYTLMPVTDENKAFRALTFTSFSTDPPDWDKLKGHLRYLAYGNEICPATERVHWQGFAYSFNVQSFSAFLKLFPKCHIETMQGNFHENELYCSKESAYTEHGLKPNEDGIKTKMFEVKRRLDEVEHHMDIAEDPECFNIVRQSTRFFKEYENHTRAKKARTDRTMPKVYIRYGDPGAGKTRWLDEQLGFDGWRCMPTNTGEWFDGCDSDVVLFVEAREGAHTWWLERRSAW